MGAVVKQEGEGDFYYGSHELSARLGSWGATRQDVVYLSVGKERTVVLGYDNLCRYIDMLCRKKEQLVEKLLVKVDQHPEGKRQPSTITKRG